MANRTVDIWLRTWTRAEQPVQCSTDHRLLTTMMTSQPLQGDHVPCDRQSEVSVKVSSRSAHGFSLVAPSLLHSQENTAKINRQQEMFTVSATSDKKDTPVLHVSALEIVFIATSNTGPANPGHLDPNQIVGRRMRKGKSVNLGKVFMRKRKNVATIASSPQKFLTQVVLSLLSSFSSLFPFLSCLLPLVHVPCVPEASRRLISSTWTFCWIQVLNSNMSRLAQA